MLLEIHVHSSRHSDCSHVSPVKLVRQALKKHLQGIVITEHHYLWSEQELKDLRAEAEVPGHFLIMAAQEVETDIGHVLVYGAERTIGGRTKLERLRRDFPEAVLVWAHPFLKGNLPGREALLNPRLDAIEIFNLNHLPRENYRGLSLWHKYRFVAVAGSDAHSRETTGLFPTQFDHAVRNMAELVAEVKAGRCRPFLKEVPSAGSHMVVTKITVGTKGEDELRFRAVIKQIGEKSGWKRVQESVAIVTSLHDRGFGEGGFRVPAIIDVDEAERVIIEEGQRGSLLFELMQYVHPQIGMKYFQLAAGWLARLHNLKLRVSPLERTIEKERRRFKSYRASFEKAGSSHTRRVERLLRLVEEREEAIWASQADRFVQVHGDYHPKNIIIGQDRAHDFSTLYISVIDFDNSLVFSPAFDLGYFISQFEYQFRHFPEVLENYGDRRFVETYLKSAREVPEGLERDITFFRVRANLSIAAYLNKVGKGESDDMESILSRAEKLLSGWEGGA